MVSKKLLFSAVAVLAFNGVAMANETIDDKDVSVLSFELKDCGMETIEKMDCLDPDHELSEMQTFTIYEILYDYCVAN